MAVHTSVHHHATWQLHKYQHAAHAQPQLRLTLSLR